MPEHLRTTCVYVASSDKWYVQASCNDCGGQVIMPVNLQRSDDGLYKDFPLALLREPYNKLMESPCARG